MTGYQEMWRLIDNKESIIEKWTREMGKEGPLAQFNLTARQRRTIAGLRWERRVAELSDRVSGEREEQPPPVAGRDANNRIVVQRIQHGTHQMWALNREGGPFDIKEPVHSLKDGRRIQIPSHIHTIQERD